jgi:acyl-CoA synthetase (AMP-forming)/AMP-acid ligase II
MRLIDFFDKGAEIEPGRAFLVEGELVRSYAEVQAMSHRIANAFHREGIGPGARAAVFSPNSARAFECVIGVLRAGCVWVPVNVRNTVEDNVYILNALDVDVLFYDRRVAPQARALLAACPNIARAFGIDDVEGPDPSLSRLIDGCGEVSEEVPQGPDEVVVLLSSGGTTGAPKGVMMTNLSWQMMIAGAQRCLWTERPIHLVAAPISHAAGGSALIMSAMGATNVLLPGFEPVMVMGAIERHRVTHLFLPPTAIYRMLAHPDVRGHDYSSLKYFQYPSAPMAPEKIKEAMEVFGPVMANAFGQSEAGTNVTFFSPEEHVQVIRSGDERRLASVGRPTLFNRVEIMDEQGNLLPPETPGEIVMRGDQLMAGYYNNPAETEAANAFGWRHTGDIGFKDADGWLFLIDRKRDVIVTGGFNVFPAEVEKVAAAHPAVQDCAVVGAPDEDWGERVTAVVELKPGAALEEADLLAFCRERLSGVKAPKAMEIWPELPRSPVGKLLRRKVRERFWEGRERKI